MRLRTLFVALGIIDFLFSSVFGWAYLLSASFRRKVHCSWRRGDGQLRVGKLAWSLGWALIANAVILVYGYFIASWLYHGIVAPRLASY